MNEATQQQMSEITATELKQRIDNGDDIQVLTCGRRTRLQ